MTVHPLIGATGRPGRPVAGEPLDRRTVSSGVGRLLVSRPAVGRRAAQHADVIAAARVA